MRKQKALEHVSAISGTFKEKNVMRDGGEIAHPTVTTPYSIPNCHLTLLTSQLHPPPSLERLHPQVICGFPLSTHHRAPPLAIKYAVSGHKTVSQSA